MQKHCLAAKRHMDSIGRCESGLPSCLLPSVIPPESYSVLRMSSHLARFKSCHFPIHHSFRRVGPCPKQNFWPSYLCQVSKFSPALITYPTHANMGTTCKMCMHPCVCVRTHMHPRAVTFCMFVRLLTGTLV